MRGKYIYFDWAMKHLLRNQMNFVVLEGFLCTLFNDHICIKDILESKSDQEDAYNKLNRLDLLAVNGQGEEIMIEIQNFRELEYFHRILFRFSKMVTQRFDLQKAYGNIKKVYSINIVYFDLGQGKDYVYRGKTYFRGIHQTDDVLQLSERQQEVFTGKEAGDIFPEYYVLRVNEFDKVAVSPLDEWIRFFKTGEIENTDTAKGLPEARERLRVDSLNDKDKRAYYRDMEAARYQQSVIETGRIEGRAEGRAEGALENKRINAMNLLKMGILSIEQIANAIGLTTDEIATLSTKSKGINS